MIKEAGLAGFYGAGMSAFLYSLAPELAPYWCGVGVGIFVLGFLALHKIYRL